MLLARAPLALNQFCMKAQPIHSRSCCRIFIGGLRIRLYLCYVCIGIHYQHASLSRSDRISVRERFGCFFFFSFLVIFLIISDLLLSLYETNNDTAITCDIKPQRPYNLSNNQCMVFVFKVINSSQDETLCRYIT